MSWICSAFSGLHLGVSFVAVSSGTFDIWNTNGNYWQNRLAMASRRGLGCRRTERMDVTEKGAALANSSSALAEPIAETGVRTRTAYETKPRRQPRYHVILWDDDDHTYEYVIRMMQELFCHSAEKGFQIAETVDKTGRAICLTTTRERPRLT